MPTRELRIRARDTTIEIPQRMRAPARTNATGKGRAPTRAPEPTHLDRDQVRPCRTLFRAASSTDSAKTANWLPIGRVREASTRVLIARTRAASEQGQERPTWLRIAAARHRNRV